MEYQTLPVTISQLIEGFRPPSASSSVFVAYDFKDSDSEKFFADVRSQLAHSPRDAMLDVMNGRVDPGQSWAIEVRERISRAKITIADVSLNSVEVYFECGLAWGLGRKLCPVVRAESRRIHVPRWMQDVQIVNYGDPVGFSSLLTLVRRISTEKTPRARDRTESAVPGKVALIAFDDSLCSSQNGLIKSACGVHGMDFVESPCLSSNELAISLPRDIADASLLVVNLGSMVNDENLYGIFAAGAVLSNPSSGVSGRNLLKQVIFVAHDVSPHKIKIFPDSAKSMRNVKIIAPSQLVVELNNFGTAYRRWVELQRNLPTRPKRASIPRRKRS